VLNGAVVFVRALALLVVIGSPRAETYTAIQARLSPSSSDVRVSMVVDRYSTEEDARALRDAGSDPGVIRRVLRSNAVGSIAIADALPVSILAAYIDVTVSGRRIVLFCDDRRRAAVVDAALEMRVVTLTVAADGHGNGELANAAVSVDRNGVLRVTHYLGVVTILAEVKQRN